MKSPVHTTSTRTTRSVKVRCPFCGSTHLHGLPEGDDQVGHRVAHCGLGAYYVTDSGVTPA